MFNFLSFFQAEQPPELVLSENFVEYYHRDPETKVIGRRTVKQEGTLTDPQLSAWKRMKFKGKDRVKLLKNIRGSSFVDPDFPHSNQSVSSEESVEPITWSRIPDIVSMGIFCTSETVADFDKVAIPNKQLKEALMFIHRTHPAKLKQLLAKDLSTQGLYEFKFYRNGIIENVIVDDYVPTVYGKPLMCGPVKGKQVFLMLIEKALAKICGSYEKIPEEMQSLLEIFFCGPLRKQKIEDLNDRERVKKAIQFTLSHKGVAGFVTKRDQKIRNFGIEQNQLYTIIDHHYAHVEDEGSIYLLELQGAKKFATWNGRFSHNDKIWEKVGKDERHSLFKRLKENKSFYLALGDVVRIFDHLIVFDGTESLNKDWVEGTSDKNYPSYVVFDAQSQDDIFLRLSTREKVRSTVILTRCHGKNDYEYLTGVYHPNKSDLQLVTKVTAGRYVLAIWNDWDFNNSGPFSIFLSSHSHISLQLANQTIYSNLLDQAFRRQSLQLRKSTDKHDFFTAKKYYTVCNLAPEIGMVYMHLDITDKNKDKLLVKIDQHLLNKQQWEVMQPNTGRELIEIEKSGRSDVMIVLKNTAYQIDQKKYFPSTAFKIIE